MVTRAHVAIIHEFHVLPYGFLVADIDAGVGNQIHGIGQTGGFHTGLVAGVAVGQTARNVVDQSLAQRPAVDARLWPFVAFQGSIIHEIFDGAGSETVHFGRLVSFARSPPGVLRALKCGFGRVRYKRVDCGLQIHRRIQRVTVAGESNIGVRHHHVRRRNHRLHYGRRFGYLVIVIVIASTAA